MTNFELFCSIGEPFAAGLFEHEDRDTFYRHCNAYYRFWEEAAMPVYNGQKIYPAGKRSALLSARDGMAVITDYSFTYSFNYNKLKAKSPEAAAIMKAEHGKVRYLITDHAVGGNGYTHCFANYKRLLAEGLNGYRARVEARPDDDFKAGLLLLLDGIELYCQRSIALLREQNA